MLFITLILHRETYSPHGPGGCIPAAGATIGFNGALSSTADSKYAVQVVFSGPWVVRSKREMRMRPVETC